MAKYLIVALNGPKEGEGTEEIYNKWYDEVHVPALLKVPGIVAARRYKTIQSNLNWPYVATYEIETDDFAMTMKAMGEGMGTFDPSFDRENSGSIVAIEL
ncbi:MAG: hypothetical protein EOP02_31870 [Proteobacteria bacterium]|nr:MAG: hypothetical protein EOP02_31870 [Pseudomonadota bacterium]